jgi:ATP-dependent DNA helicase RecQ
MALAMSDLLSQARARLKSVFGYDDFRPGQSEIIEAVMSGAPVLAVMPTGSGKSLCFQLPSILEKKLTIVVSPLIALMRDQVQQLRSLGVPAASLNSQNVGGENAQTMRSLRAGELRLLYVSPERLLMDGTIEGLREANPQRLAIDEAHCVSEWGHDFRPEYRELGRAARALGVNQVAAFTATADKTTRADIAQRLFEGAPKLFLHSFDRPNLELNFAAKNRPREQLARFLEGHKGESGVVYCASRRATEDLAQFLADKGHRAVPYHAGLDHAVRMANQDRFLQEDGVVVAATIAFGMGVNKPDVRFVAHADMPSSVEAYYQEIGRAGRDGLPADTLTLYGLDDMSFRRRQIDQKEISDERRRIEHGRLAALIDLCESPRCRRQTLLAYFDEEAPLCGRCDHCLGRVAMRDGTVEAQKILSAAMRTGQRFGAGYLADILTGDATPTVLRNGHQTIKTFGVGKEHSKKAWAAIIRQVFAAGALRSASDEHGGFALTPRGEEILYGREKIQLREEAASPRAMRGPDANAPRKLVDVDPVLRALKHKRLELARDAGVAAFMIFPDRTLLDMVEKRPATLNEMRDVYGVGERKLALYGDEFLVALREALK